MLEARTAHSVSPMSESNGRDGQARPRRDYSWLYAVGRFLLVGIGIAVFIRTPLPDLNLPLPNVREFLQDLPKLPAWTGWLKLSALLVFVVLCLIAAHEKRAKQDQSQGVGESDSSTQGKG
jgi:hypothetical protein